MTVLRRPIIGIAYFDDPEKIEGGWMSTGDSVSRFNSHAELQQNQEINGEKRPVYWVTNTSWFVFNDAFKGVSYLLRSNFFAVSPDMVAANLGFDRTSSDRRSMVAAIGKTYRRAWDIMAEAWPGIVPVRSVAHAIMNVLEIKDNPDFNVLVPILEGTHQNGSQVTTSAKYEAGMTTVRLLPNRVRHTEAVTAFGIPDGKWKYDSSIDSVESALNAECPVLVECEVNMRGSELAELCAHGNEWFSKGGRRQYMFQPELLMLAEYATSIKVTRAMTWETFTPSPRLPDVFFREQYTSLSYSAGVAAHSFYKAITGTRYSAAKHREYLTPRGVWLSAVDRAISFGSAKLLHDEGFRVTGYGDGEVHVRIFEHEQERLEEVASEAGFMIMSMVRRT